MSYYMHMNSKLDTDQLLHLSLESPQHGNSNEYIQFMFSRRIKKNSNIFGWTKQSVTICMVYSTYPSVSAPEAALFLSNLVELFVLFKLFLNPLRIKKFWNRRTISIAKRTFFQLYEHLNHIENYSRQQSKLIFFLFFFWEIIMFKMICDFSQQPSTDSHEMLSLFGL